MEESRKLALLGDMPIGETADDRKDQLEFNSYATVLANAAMDTSDPITIGIFGDWGVGKTSLMRLMHTKVHKSDTSVPVWFNAWQYEREEHLIVPLTATIAKELSKEKKNWDKKIKEHAQKLKDAIRAIAYGISIKGKVGIPFYQRRRSICLPKI